MNENVNIPDSNITTDLTFRKLVFMNMQALTNFPYIENDFDALTDYELLSLVVKYLNDVIENQNDQNDSITNLYNSFLALQTYVNNTKDTLEDAFNTLDNYVRTFFENLDLQEEVNNKLDEMLEDGVLEQIIEQYLNSKAVFCFNTIADLKAATNLIDGSEVRLLGNTTYNDGVNEMFLVTTRTVDDVDGENDTIVINDNLVAKRIKVKENLPLKPNITSNEKIENLHIVNESTSTASAGIAFNNQENVTVSHNNIEGGYWSARIGNENDSADTTGIKLINNKLTSPHGLSLRQRTNQTTGGEHTLAFNDIINTQSNPGIESWSKKSQILFNRIKNISGSVGGTGGITMGAKPNQMSIGNYINGFHYGIEIGVSNLNMACNNFIENTDYGIVCSSDNSDDVIIANNIIQINADGRGIYLRSGKRVIIENCIIIYGNTLGDYNDSSSRSGTGIYSDTYEKDVTISNCTFLNLADVRVGDGFKISNCCFYNIQNVYVSGNTTFNNCCFRNVNNIGITGANSKYQIFNECTFKRDIDNITMNEYVINGRAGSNPTIAEFNSCMNINCQIDSMKSNTEMGGSDKRFVAQKIDGIYHTYNKAQLSDLVTALSSVGFTLKAGDKVVDNYNNKVWEVMTQGRQISYQNAIPTTGAFVKGDRVYNNFATTTTVDYWLCTVTGEFGTATEPTFVAKNV